MASTLTYAGIGSRETPFDVQNLMTAIAIRLREVYGYTLRTGGAEGADQAFMAGAMPNYELYVPWKGFNDLHDGMEPTLMAFDIAKQFHPAWHRCKTGARKLHARNSHIILGPHLNNASKFVVCWTPGGEIYGGTGQAMRLAMANAVPVFNLYHQKEALKGLHRCLQEGEP